MSQRHCALILLSLFATYQPALAQNLPLQAFLKQVQEKHEGLRASKENVEGTTLAAHESDLLVLPSFFTNFQSYSDAKPNPLIPSPLYQKTRLQSLQVGLSEQTRFGLQSKLSYTYGTYEYVGLGPANYDVHTTLELSQPLWRNGFGSETRDQIDQIKSQNDATNLSEQYRVASYLFEAESNYWRLALARQSAKVSEEAYGRAQKIFDYVSRKTGLELADRADFFQARAALEARKLDLKTNTDEVHEASRALNGSRGIDSDEVTETLESLDGRATDQIGNLKKLEPRLDVKAAEAAAKATAAGARMSQERDKPTLEAFGALTYNGVSTDSSVAAQNSYQSTAPTQSIGVRFSMPLDIGVATDSRKGWLKQELASQSNYNRKLFEETRDWNLLVQKIKQARERLTQAEVLEKAQKEKLDYEKTRHARGRTTLINVLNFEVDYELAQLGRIRTVAELLQLNAQAKLYGGTSESR